MFVQSEKHNEYSNNNDHNNYNNNSGKTTRHRNNNNYKAIKNIFTFCVIAIKKQAAQKTNTFKIK